VAAALEYAVGERIIHVNPGIKVDLPGAKLRKPTKRAYSLDEIRRLLSVARSVSLREHLIVRIFYVCGSRPGELFALRVDDVEPALLRIDEAPYGQSIGTVFVPSACRCCARLRRRSNGVRNVTLPDEQIET
jgi:integrase